MGSLKEIKSRISSVHSTIQVTSAMKMVSSAKFKKASSIVQKINPYFESIQDLYKKLTLQFDEINLSFPELFSTNDSKRVLLVVISSNRGLAGAFNSSIIKEVNRRSKEIYPNDQVDLFIIGKKAGEVLKKNYSIFVESNDFWDAVSYLSSKKLSNIIMDEFKLNTYRKVDLIYNDLRAGAQQKVVTEQLLPLKLPSINEINTFDHTLSLDYIFEPSKEEIAKDLIPMYFNTKFYMALMCSLACEHNSRMIAMQSATDNATELKDNLTIIYNKARQASITNEIIEIVSGAQSM